MNQKQATIDPIATQLALSRSMQDIAQGLLIYSSVMTYDRADASDLLDSIEPINRYAKQLTATDRRLKQFATEYGRRMGEI